MLRQTKTTLEFRPNFLIAYQVDDYSKEGTEHEQDADQIAHQQVEGIRIAPFVFQQRLHELLEYCQQEVRRVAKQVHGDDGEHGGGRFTDLRLSLLRRRAVLPLDPRRFY